MHVALNQPFSDEEGSYAPSSDETAVIRVSLTMPVFVGIEVVPDDCRYWVWRNHAMSKEVTLIYPFQLID